MKRLAILCLSGLTVLGTAAVACGQDFPHYLRLRHQNKIDHVSDPHALLGVTGTKVLELEGAIGGTFRTGDKTALLLNGPGSFSQEVDTDFVPDWLDGYDAPVRLLVKAIRTDESTPLRVVLLAVARGQDVAKIEAADAEKRAASMPKPKPKPRSEPALDAAQGDGALYGQIGPGGTHVTRSSSGNLTMDDIRRAYASFIKAQNPRLRNSEAFEIGNNIIDYCGHYRIDPRLVISVVLAESGFDPAEVSRAGAVGLGQLMPGTARWMGVQNSYNIKQNVYGMVKLLRTLLNMYTRQTSDYGYAWELTLAAYNAGDGAVRRHRGIPPYRDTQAYVRKVLTIWARLART